MSDFNFKHKYPELKLKPVQHIELPNISIGLKGRFKLQVRKATNHDLVRELEFDNLITNNGLDYITNASYNWPWNVCAIGQGTNTPAVTDTSLQSLSAWAACASSATTQTVETSGLYRVTTRYKYTFNAGTLNGNYTEVSIGYSSTNIFSRALFLDGSGNPTTITVASDEYLDVFYYLSLIPALVDVPFTVSLSGVNYTGFIRMVGVGLTGTLGSRIPNSTMSIGSLSDWPEFVDAWSGNAAPIVGTTKYPSGTFVTASSTTRTAYVNGTKYLQRTSTWTPASGAFTIKTIGFFKNYDWGLQFNAQFDTAINKTAQQTFSLTYRISWDRV